jgi:hypothetical protein
VVGSIGVNKYKGAVYVFQQNTTSPAWAQVQKVVPPDAVDYDYVGGAVSISGSTFAASARNTKTGDKAGSGVVYIFAKSGNEPWTVNQTLKHTVAITNGLFGQSVSLDGDTLAVGTWAPNGTQKIEGSVYVYTRTGTGAPFTLQQMLFGTTTGSGDHGEQFGASMALQGDILAVGASNSGNPQKGAAYVFARSAQVWGTPVRLVPDDLADHNQFGTAVALDGDTLVVGAAFNGCPYGCAEFSGLGAAYVYVNTAGTWNLQQKLTASDGVVRDYFGAAVAIEGDRIVVGAPGAQSGVGRVYAFTRSGAAWTEETAKYDPKKNDASADDQVSPLKFGGAWAGSQGFPAGQSGAYRGGGIALQGTTLMVSAYLATADVVIPSTNKGAVYVIPVNV